MEALFRSSLSSPYVLSGVGLLFIVVLVIAFTRGRKAGYRRAWKPLVRVVDGVVQTDKTDSTLTGEYRGHAILARISNGSAQGAITFHIVTPAGPGGRDWEIAHRSEKLLGPETWRAFTQDPALQQRIESARVPERFQGWPKSTTVSYDSRRGTLSLSEEGAAPSGDHFRAQLEVLEAMLEVNREMNAG